MMVLRGRRLAARRFLFEPLNDLDNAESLWNVQRRGQLDRWATENESGFRLEPEGCGCR